MPATGKRTARRKTPIQISKNLTPQHLPTILHPSLSQTNIMENIVTITTLPLSSSSKPNQKNNNESDSDSDIAELFHQPKKPHRPTQPLVPQTQTTLSNRFKPLETSLSMETETDTRPEQGQSEPPRNTPKTRAPAPVIIAGKVTDHTALINTIEKQVTKGFSIKYTKNNANVYFNNKTDKDKFVAIIKNKNVQYHTYTDSTEKTHAFVLRGLDNTPTVEELQNELKKTEVDVIKTFRMTTQHRPLYLVITDAQMTLSKLQQSVKCLFHARVTWERHINKKIITQCHRCQCWGHATTNCNRNPKCVKCAGDHLTITCSKTRDTPAKCVNCAQNHPANSTTCPAYIRKLEEAARNNPRLAERLNYESVAKSQPQYIPAPIPKSNPWTRPQTQRTPNLEDFPSLPTRSSTTPHFIQRQQPPKQPSMGDNPISAPLAPPQTITAAAPTNNIGQTRTLITDLCSEINTLNSLINLKNLLKFVTDMNNELKTTSDQQSRAFIAIEYMSNISSYNI